MTGGVTVIFPLITPSRLAINSYIEPKEVKLTTTRARKKILNSL